MTPLVTRTAILIAAVILGAGAGRLIRPWRTPRSGLRADTASPGLVIVTAPFCARCRVLLDRLGHLAPDMHIDVRDIRDHPALADALDIRTAPTLLVFDHAATVIDRSDGVPNGRRLEQLLATARRVSVC